VQILPSGGQPASSLALSPFRGLRYAEDRVSGLAEVTSPPYDVIVHDTADHLLASDPHNVVRLILPRHDAGNPGNAYTDAARTLAEWRATGILVPDPQPALYVYEQKLPSGPVLQRGLIGALHLVPLDAGPVLPHEDVIPGPVAGRRQLMEATAANLEPIFLLYDGEPAPDGATALVQGVADTREPLLGVVTDDGLSHRLWAVTDPAEHKLAATDLARRQAMIADGHHRYAAYLQLQARKHAAGAGGGPWDAGLALLVDSEAFPPRIGAIHRVITGLPITDAVTRAKGAFTVQPLPMPRSRDVTGAVREASAGTAAFVLAGGGDYYLLTAPDPAAVEAAMPDRSARWRWLPAAIMQELLFRRLWGVSDTEDAVQIHHDAAGALRAVAPPAEGTAVICPPLSSTDVREVAAHGERVPRKSTSFAPKPRTGLVLRAFALG
jgi:uncharacterized protein (DUF1015 family)